MRTSKPMPYTGKEREHVQRLARSRNTAQKVVLRAKIVLKKMEGLKQEAIAEQLGTSRVDGRSVVWKISERRNRGITEGCSAFGEDTRSCRKTKKRPL